MVGRTNILRGDGGDIDYSILTWSDCTEDEIADMVSFHYKGIIDISDYWNIGDERLIRISDISSGTVNESYTSCYVYLVIIGINHDTLATKNGTRAKAAITVQSRCGLNSVAGYMNNAGDDPSYALWSKTSRRTWCNNDFKSALPSYLQSLIKPVTKYTNRYGYCGGSYDYSSYRIQETTTDSCFLLSEWEIFGCYANDSSTYGTLSADGTQYEYMKTTSNRMKVDSATRVSGGQIRWWGRTGYIPNSMNNYGVRFIYCSSSGSSGTITPNFDLTYVVPAFCL
jgi:hypothetical protein